MKTMTKISAFILILLVVQTHAQSGPGNGPTGAAPHSGAHVSHPPTTDPVTQNEGLSYWEKEFQANTQKLYQTFEIFFVDFVVPTYHMVKESALLTTAVLLFFILYFTKAISGLFKGEGTTKKFKYNKEEPISYADLNQHFKNFTKELDELKQQVKKGPEGQPADTQAASSGPVNVPELEKLTKSLGKTEDHLTKLYQENKQLNHFLASFQKEILESHKEIWKELHSLKTSRPASTLKSGERRGQSVSAEDRIPKRMQDTPSRPLEGTVKTQPKPTDAGLSKTTVTNGPGHHPQPIDTSVTKSQELTKSAPNQDQHGTTETKPTESTNPFISPDKVEQKPPGPGMGSTIGARQPGFGRPITQPRPGMGPIKQPPFGTATTTADTQKAFVSQPEQKEEAQKPTPTDTNPTAGAEKTTETTEIATKNDTEPTATTTEEEKSSTTTEQTNPEDPTQMSGLGAGPFRGIPPKKPTPVVRNNFAIPQKRVNPVPGNVKKPPSFGNPGANFVPNPDGGSANI